MPSGVQPSSLVEPDELSTNADVLAALAELEADIAAEQVVAFDYWS